MFWKGFIGFYVVIGLLVLLMTGSQKLFNKFVIVLLRCKRVVCAVIFTLFSFVFTLLYSMVAISLGDIVLSGPLCALFLVFSWFVVEKLYQLIAGEKGSDNKESIVLTKEDKNVCNLFSLFGVVWSSVVLCYEDRSLEYVILICIAVSIWIGAYIPVSEIYSGTSLGKVLCIIASEFKSKKISVWLSAILSAAVVTILVSKNELVQKLNVIIDQIGFGIVAGSVVMVLVLIFWGFCKQRKRKSKKI